MRRKAYSWLIGLLLLSVCAVADSTVSRADSEDPLEAAAQLRCQELNGIHHYSCNGNLFNSGSNYLYDILAANLSAQNSGTDIFAQSITTTLSLCTPSWLGNLNGCQSGFTPYELSINGALVPEAHALYGANGTKANLQQHFNSSTPGCMEFTGFNWWTQLSYGKVAVCFLKFGRDDALLSKTAQDSTAFFDVLDPKHTGDEFICAYAVLLSEQQSQAQDVDFIGCVATKPTPFPPIFNVTLIPMPEKASTLALPPENEQMITAWLRSLPSFFDNPSALLRIHSPIAGGTVNEYLGTYSLGSSNLLQCGTFISVNKNSPSLSDNYCLLMPNANDLCVYKNPITSNEESFDLSQFQVANMANLMGCIPRPALSQNSENYILAYYQTAVDADNNVYQGVIPLVISGAQKGTPFGNDTDGDDIFIGTNYTLYRARDQLPPICDIGLNANAAGNSITPVYGTQPCNLVSHVTITTVPFTVQNPPSSTQGGIREYFQATNSQGCNYYANDIAYLPTYNVQVQAIIPQLTGEQSAELPYIFANIVPKGGAQNCADYTYITNAKSSRVGQLYIAPAGQRDNTYCVCGATHSPYSITTESSAFTSCACPVCYKSTGGTPANIIPNICPGVYSGPSTNTPGAQDQICLRSTPGGWDFISGNNLAAQINGTTSSQVPGLICTPLSVSCQATYNTNEVVPNLGNGIWPDSTTPLGQTATGTCGQGYNYGYNNSAFAINFPTGVSNAAATQELQELLQELPTGQTLTPSMIMNSSYTALQQAYTQYGLICQMVAPTATCIGGVLGNVQNPCVSNTQSDPLYCSSVIPVSAESTPSQPPAEAVQAPDAKGRKRSSKWRHR